jgi:hypothetical protein
MDRSALAGVTRENEFWNCERLFEGETVFCMASGPSLTREVVGQVGARRSIVVNSSCSMASWASVLFFTDCSWYEPRRELVASWPGMVMTMCPTAKREMPDKVRRIRTCGDPDLSGEFPPAGSGLVRQGRSSGHTAISLAIAMGAARVVLLGYDCQLVDGREHHHDEYLVGGRVHYENYRDDPRWNNKREYSTVFLRGYDGWKELAARAGATILNATPGSAITEFDFVELADILKGC